MKTRKGPSLEVQFWCGGRGRQEDWGKLQAFLICIDGWDQHADRSVGRNSFVEGGSRSGHMQGAASQIAEGFHGRR